MGSSGMNKRSYKSLVFMAVLVGFPISNVLIFLSTQFSSNSALVHRCSLPLTLARASVAGMISRSPPESCERVLYESSEEKHPLALGA